MIAGQVAEWFGSEASLLLPVIAAGITLLAGAGNAVLSANPIPLRDASLMVE